MRPYINEATTNFIEFYKHFSFLKCCDCGVAGWSRLASEVTVASDITIKYVTIGGLSKDTAESLLHSPT